MTKNTSYLRVTNKADGAIELLVYGVIGDDYFGDGVTAKAVADELNESPDAPLLVRIHSPGGFVDEGVAIANAFASRTGEVRVRVEGVAASIASYLAMFADDGKLEIFENAEFMIHEAWSFAAGNAADFAAKAERLDQISNKIAKAYADRSGKALDEVRAIMKAEKYFTASEAVEFGIADVVLDRKAKPLALDSRAMNAVRSHMSRVPALVFEEASQRVTQKTKPGASQAKEPSAPGKQQAQPKGQRMSNIISPVLARTCGLPESSDEASIIEFVNSIKSDQARLLGAVGADSVEAALGRVAAMASAAEKLTEVSADNERLSQKLEEEESDRILASLKDPKSPRITPAQEKNLWPTLSLEGKRAFAESAAPVGGAQRISEPAPGDKETRTENKKAWSDMSPAERAALGRRDINEYRRLKAEAGL